MIPYQKVSILSDMHVHVSLALLIFSSLKYYSMMLGLLVEMHDRFVSQREEEKADSSLSHL